MNARATAAWTGACLFIVLSTSDPVYKAVVLCAAAALLWRGAGPAPARRLGLAVAAAGVLSTVLNFVSAHLGATVLFALPAGIPAIGGPYTLEALAAGAVGGLTLCAAILAAASLSLLTEPQEVIDALPGVLSRTGTAVAASLNLVPSVARSFVEVSEVQRMRGWRPRGPRSLAEVVVPVVLTSVEASIQLAESMEARGFGSGRRTSIASHSLVASDWCVVAASLLAVLAFALARATGWAADWYPYPSLQPPPVDAVALVASLLLLAPVALWRSRS